MKSEKKKETEVKKSIKSLKSEIFIAVKQVKPISFYEIDLSVFHSNFLLSVSGNNSCSVF